MSTLLAKPPLGASVIVASLAANMLGLVLPLVMLQVFDRVIPNQAIETLFVLAIGLAATILIDFVLKVCRILVATHIGEEFERTAAATIAQRLFNTKPEAHGDMRDTDRFEATASIALLRDHYSGEGRLAAIDLPFAVIFVVAVAWIGGELAYVLIASFAILIAMSAVFRSKQRQVHAERKSIDGRRFSFFAEFLSKMHVIKSNCMETPMLRRYEVLQGQSVAASKRLITVNGMSQAFSATMSQATLGAIALAGAIMVINGSLGIAELAACTLLSGRAIQPMFKVTGMWVQGESASLAKQRCAEVLALPQRRPKATDRLVGALRFEDVTVTLKGRADPLFQSVSFGSHPGECIALTGDDGVGKTTFLRLILGEQTPSKGRVLLDGRPAHDFLRARGEGGIAYLDQKPIVFETSILQNMTLSHDPARAQKVIQLSEKLGLSEAVNRLPDGYETLIGGKGATPLPEGTLQLIALVRALSTSPKILLFNEANTAMDSRTDEATQKALFEIIGQTTMVIVTRRPSYVAMANKQINLTQKGVTINHLNELKFRFTNQRSVSFEQPLRQSNDPGATETDVRKPVAVA